MFRTPSLNIDCSIVEIFFPFSYDNVDLSRPARHWVDPTIPAAGRFNFIFSRLGASVLQIEAVASREMGLYRCRVDYDHHHTLIWWSHLDIVGKGITKSLDSVNNSEQSR